MKAETTTEKIILWMHRNKQTQLYLANALNTTRQTIAKKMNDNSFTDLDIKKLRELGIQV